MTKGATGSTTSRKSGVANARTLLERAVSGGLTEGESVFLKMELGRLSARVAEINASVGVRVVEMSPYARLVGDTGASVAVTV